MRTRSSVSACGTASLAPLEVDLQDVEGLLASGELRRHAIAQLLADERARERREDRDAAPGRLGLVRAHDPVADCLACLVLEPHGGSEGDPVAAARRLDHLRGA